MEYPSKNDFYFKFKAIYNLEGNFIDYELLYVSDTFFIATKMDPKLILGKKFAEIVVENEDILGFKELYLNMIPKARFKTELFIEELERWYLINIFTDKNDQEDLLIINYVDVTNIRQNTQSNLESLNDASDNIFYLKDIDKRYYKDRLTGLYNKNFLEEEILRLDTKRQLPMSLIMGDINGLKLINNAFGHIMGDSALKKAAEIMTDCFRDEDIISRIGGDEFIILLPKTSEETA
ncbi:MAG: GGDEF domain-containing protein, partial [Sedimentibacter sp.]